MTATDDRFAKMQPFDPTGRRRYAAAELPPGPRWPTLLQSIALVRFRHQFVPAMHRRYGDVFTVRIMPKGQPLVLFTRPEHTKEIFAGDPEVFHAGKGNAILGPIMGEHSLLLQDSGEHKRARKLLMPAFNGQVLRGYETVVSQLAKEEVDRWTPGEELRSLDRMNALTLEVILRVVFGVTDESRLARLRPLVNNTVNVSPAVLLGWGYPFLQRFGPWKATVENQRALDEVMYDEIARRRTAPDLAERTDVLSQLLRVTDEGGLSDHELRDQLVTLLLAGHETTATALAWAVELLLANPDKLDALRADLPNGDDYLNAVIHETMRLRPPLPMFDRMVCEPIEVLGYRIPKGAVMACNIARVHRRPDLYPDPLAFRPERFLDSPPETYGWVPFGGGVRRCLGAAFAQVEMQTVLQTLAESVALEAVGGAEAVRRRGITLAPSRGGQVRALAAR